MLTPVFKCVFRMTLLTSGMLWMPHTHGHMDTHTHLFDYRRKVEQDHQISCGNARARIKPGTFLPPGDCSRNPAAPCHSSFFTLFKGKKSTSCFCKWTISEVNMKIASLNFELQNGSSYSGSILLSAFCCHFPFFTLSLHLLSSAHFSDSCEHQNIVSNTFWRAAFQKNYTAEQSRALSSSRKGHFRGGCLYRRKKKKTR